MVKYYPIFLDIKGKRCVVVGGGEVARRKVSQLLRTGAKVEVISPEFSPRLGEMGERGEVACHQRPYQEGDLKGAFLAIAATDEAEVNRAVAEEAERRGVLVNVVDDSKRCRFILPSLVRRGELTVAISTGGASPALARRIRKELEAHIGPEYGVLLDMASSLRRELKKNGQVIPARRWEAALNEEVLHLVKEGYRERAKEHLASIIQDLGKEKE